MRSRRRQLLLGLLAHGLRHAGLLDLARGTPRRPSPRPRRAPCGSTPSACAGSTRAAGARRPACTSSRILARTCSSARRSRCSSSARVSRSVTSSVSSSSILSREAQVRRVAGRVGQRAGPGDRAQERADARVGAAQVEDLLDHRAVLALRASRTCSSWGSGSSWTVTSTRRVPDGSVLAAPGTPRATPSHGDGGAAARECACARPRRRRCRRRRTRHRCGAPAGRAPPPRSRRRWSPTCPGTGSSRRGGQESGFPWGLFPGSSASVRIDYSQPTICFYNMICR